MESSKNKKIWALISVYGSVAPPGHLSGYATFNLSVLDGVGSKEGKPNH